ncbi:MAG TPA: DUF2169 domain-containing protein [Polyangiaceae bacterium]|jgi:uncharacterized protein YjbI with pentapeptide repeats
MKVVKPNQVSVLSRPYDHENKYGLCVAGLVLFPFAEPRYPMTESSLWLLVGKELAETVLDESMPKPHGEVLLKANACAPGGKPTGVLRVAVEMDGKLLKELAVVGDRVWEQGAPSEPAPFVKMPITWANAFGGPEFKRNPLGKGHHAKDGSPLPNIEDRTRLLTSPRQTPEPAGFFPYDLSWPQRLEKAGKYDHEWLDKLYPGLAKDIDWTFFNVAPPDQHIPGFFRGDEEFLLRNLHPEHPELRCKLPGVQLRCFMRRRTRSGPELESELAMQLDTVWLFPEASHGIVIFRGTAPIREDDAADVTVLYVACEDLGKPKPLDHYARALERRLDREKGPVEALDDRPLMPVVRAGMKRPPSPADEMADLVAYERLTHENMLAKTAREVDKARAILVANGLDPDAHGPAPIAPFEQPESIEEMLEMSERAQKTLADEQRKAEERAVLREEEIRKTCEAAGIDFAELQKEWRGPFRGGPPDPSAPLQIAQLWAMAEEGRAAGVDVGEIEGYLRDPEFVGRIQKHDEMALEAYRLAAQDRTAPEPLPAEESARLRAELLEAHGRGESLAGRNLTGADLSGIALPGADLEDALMEGCDLSGANLSGARLGRAVLVRANLKEARFDGAKMQRANLSKAECTATSFVDCLLKEAFFDGTTLQSCVLDGANLDRASFDAVVVRRCSLRRVRAAGATLDAIDLTGSCLAEAVLDGAVFLKCMLERVDFTGARLGAATLLGCNADGAIFAKISGASFRVVEATTLAGCDFREADLTGASLRGANLAGSDLSMVRAALCDFSECNLQGANLHGAKAKQARFVRTDLTRANLAGADLFEASLSKAILDDANLTGANLYQADVSMIRGNANTLLVEALTVRARVKPFHTDKVQDLD